MDGVGQRFPSSAQKRREQPKQTENFDKRREYRVKVQVSARGGMDPGFVAENLIVRQMSNIGAGPSEE